MPVLPENNSQAYRVLEQLADQERELGAQHRNVLALRDSAINEAIERKLNISLAAELMSLPRQYLYEIKKKFQARKAS